MNTLRISSWLALVGIALCQTACHPSGLAPAEFIQYVNDASHGLRQQQQVGATTVVATYQPADLFVARAVKAATSTLGSTDSLRKQYNDATHFLLSVSRNERSILQPSEGFSSYSSLLQTLAFRMQDKARLVTSQGDTLRPVNYYLDRTMPGMSATQLLLTFPKAKLLGTWRLQLQEFGLDTGNLVFVFDAQQAGKVPALVID